VKSPIRSFRSRERLFCFADSSGSIVASRINF